MAGRCRRSSLIVPATTVLLLLAANGLLLAFSAAEDKKKAGTMRIRYANEEESRWLDRFAETHEPLEGGRGPLLMRRATEEEARRMESLGKPTGGGGDVLEFDQDNPYYHAIQAWAKRLIKERGGVKFVDAPHVEKQFQAFWE